MVFGLVPCLSTISWLGRGPLRDAISYAYEEAHENTSSKVTFNPRFGSSACKGSKCSVKLSPQYLLADANASRKELPPVHDCGGEDAPELICTSF